MNYIGIDLGTTNSVVSTFDGEHTRVWKNKKDQSDVTPSAIYVDKRGKRFYGKAAYVKAAQDPARTASLFKRFMGTTTKIEFAGESHTPEECSAEILREVFKNLPEEIRNSDDNAIVITVPAAFDQMQNAATLEAAKLAGLGSHVSLMQEPVAAIMSIMQVNKTDGTFLIYDLGGGTLDIAIGESIGGKVNLLAHGGIAMCGGRDFDRLILNNKIIPWINENYHVPANIKVEPALKTALRVATYLGEMAKIELSSDDDTVIEGETTGVDLDKEELYLDIPFFRQEFDSYIEQSLMESIQAARDTIQKAGLTAHDFDRIIFIGGPTNYKPLRDKVCKELGIPGSIEVNPMTAVSEGAAIFAESIDWNSENHERKNERGEIRSADELGLSFKYMARTTDSQAKIAAVLEKAVTGYTFEISSIDTGWNSGTLALEHGMTVIVPLMKKGDNCFVVVVYDSYGREISLGNSRIIIAQTMATIGSIVASHSIGVEVRCNSDSSESTLEYLVREGDELPAKGIQYFRAAETIRAHSDNSINFKLWEGDIDTQVDDNRFIGCMTISGKDFDFGAIITGAQIICEYTISDSGSVELTISIPSIDEDFSGKNFYSRTEGEMDMAHAAEDIADDAKKLLGRIKDIGPSVGTSAKGELQAVAEEISRITMIDNTYNEPEDVKKASDDLLKAKRIVNHIKKENKTVIRQYQLQHLKKFYQETMRMQASSDQISEYSTLFSLAEQAIKKNDSSFDNLLDQIRYLNYRVSEKDPEFILRWFIGRCVQGTYPLELREEAEELIERGVSIMQGKSAMSEFSSDEISEIHKISNMLDRIRIDDEKNDGATANIVKG